LITEGNDETPLLGYLISSQGNDINKFISHLENLLKYVTLLRTNLREIITRQVIAISLDEFLQLMLKTKNVQKKPVLTVTSKVKNDSDLIDLSLNL
jgi:hypothetical protein